MNLYPRGISNYFQLSISVLCLRVCSKDIAAELLEMTFGSKVDIQEW